MRLIDADALPIAKEYCVDEAGFGCNFYVVHKSDIDKAPTIDAKPVKYGKWIVLGQRTYGSGGGRNYTHYCSECGQHGFEDYKLCPNCGADMRERKET